MATCTNTNPCTNGEKVNFRFGLPRFDPVGPIEYNTTVTISIDIIDQSLIYGEDTVVDVVDTTTGDCIWTGASWLPKGMTQVVSFQVTMPNNDLHLRISGSSLVIPLPPLPPYLRCEDVVEFTIKQKYVKYDCVNKQCVGPVKDGTFADQIACAASGCIPPVPKYTDYNCVSGICTGNIQTGLGQFANLKVCTDSGCKAPSSGTGICNDPMKWGCTAGIPNTYLVAGAFLFIVMSKK